MSTCIRLAPSTAKSMYWSARSSSWPSVAPLQQLAEAGHLAQRLLQVVGGDVGELLELGVGPGQVRGLARSSSASAASHGRPARRRCRRAWPPWSVPSSRSSGADRWAAIWCSRSPAATGRRRRARPLRAGATTRRAGRARWPGRRRGDQRRRAAIDAPATDRGGAVERLRGPRRAAAAGRPRGCVERARGTRRSGALPASSAPRRRGSCHRRGRSRWRARRSSLCQRSASACRPGVTPVGQPGLVGQEHVRARPRAASSARAPLVGLEERRSRRPGRSPARRSPGRLGAPAGRAAASRAGSIRSTTVAARASSRSPRAATAGHRRPPRRRAPRRRRGRPRAAQRPVLHVASGIARAGRDSRRATSSAAARRWRPRPPSISRSTKRPVARSALTAVDRGGRPGPRARGARRCRRRGPRRARRCRAAAPSRAGRSTSLAGPAGLVDTPERRPGVVRPRAPRHRPARRARGGGARRGAGAPCGGPG